MSLHAVKMLGISITTDPKEKILEEIYKYLSSGPQSSVVNHQKAPKPFVLVTPNPEQIVLAQKNKRFADILNRADVAIPDGIGLVWASQLVHRSPFTVSSERIQQRIPGVELMQDLVQMAAKQGYSIGLIGGRGSVAVEAFECLGRANPGIAGFSIGDVRVGDDGDEGTDIKILRYTDTKSRKEKTLKGRSVSRLISLYLRNFASPLILFVGLGAPKQEYFMEMLFHSFHRSPVAYHPLVFMSVGGSFDTIAGRIPRAPLVIRSIGFEWFWRLLVQPWRWKRQLALFRFVFLVLGQKYSPTL